MPVSTHTISGIELFDVTSISRATIADGNLLNTYVYEPLTRNEDILASAVGSAYNAIDDINITLQDKKDKQAVISLSGSATKTVKKITQNANGVVSAEFENIALTPNVEITSPSGTLDVKSLFDAQTNTKTFEIDVSANNTYSANITYNAAGEQTTSAMPSVYFDEILQKVKNNENVTIALTYDKIFPHGNSTQTYSLQASYTYEFNNPQTSTVSALEFSTIQKDYNTSVSKVIMLRAANSTDWQYSEESLAFDGNYVSAGNNQHLTMVTANALPETLQQNIIYII